MNKVRETKMKVRMTKMKRALGEGREWRQWGYSGDRGGGEKGDHSCTSGTRTVAGGNANWMILMNTAL